jgi:predicted GIY-YIG superfamily endonuclease
MTSINFYKITSANTDKVYVGITEKDINARLQNHEAHYIIDSLKTVNIVLLLLSKFLNVKTIKLNSLKIKFVKVKKSGIRLNVNILLIHPTLLIKIYQEEHQNNIIKITNKS